MRRGFIFVWLLLAPLVRGQAIEVGAGSSDLLGTGAGVSVYFPTNTLYIGGGLASGRTVIGASDSFLYRQDAVTIGDKLFGFTFDGTGISVVNRGLTVERGSDSEHVTLFAGLTGAMQYNPFFHGLESPKNFGAGFFLQKKIGAFQLSSLEVIAGSKKTVTEGFQYQRRIFRLAGSGGILNNARFLNGLADLQPATWLRFSANHQNYFWPQRTTFDSLSAFGSLGHFSVQASVMEGDSLGQKVIGESAGVGVHFGVFSENSNWFHSGQQRFITHTVMENFRRVFLSQVITNSAGKTTTAFGGGVHFNAVSVTVSHSVLFFVLNGRGFEQITSIQISFRIPHTDAAVNLSNTVDPRAGTHYTAWASEYLYGRSALFSGATQPRSAGKFLVYGEVLEESGAPVFGAVLRIGKVLLITNERGEFTLRSHKQAKLPLAVLTAEFELGEWTLIDAPAFVSVTTESEPVRVVVRRKT